MGGDHLPCFTSEDELSSLENDYPEYPSHHSSFYRDDSRIRDGDEDESLSGPYEFVSKECDEVSDVISLNSVEFDGDLRRRKISYNEIMKNYDELWVRKEGLHQAKSKILSYNPGSWISNAGGKKLSNYAIPKTTTLLLIGPKGSGKSSLVNRISRVFEDDRYASERAQVTYNQSTGEGTYFLQEYMIPRGSNSFCLFDTRSLSENVSDNDEVLQRWMTKGIRHGELIIRDSDAPSLKMSLKCKAQQSGSPSSVSRKVNFVIFVVNGFQVLRSMNSDKKVDRAYVEMVAKTFSCPYMSYKDDKPVIAVTHGDLISLGDRARVRVYLGEKLGIPPVKQIFDIPDNSDPTSELAIVDMIRYALEHADKYIPCNESRDWVDRSTFFVDGVKDKVSGTSFLTLIFTAILLGIACIMMPMNQVHKHNDPLVASAIKWSSNKAQHHYAPHEPLVTSQSESGSTSAKNGGDENADPQATSTPAPTLPSESVVVTSEATLTSKTSAPKAEQAVPSKSALITSEPTLPLESAVITSDPTLPSKSILDYPHKRRESRSSSPEKDRHKRRESRSSSSPENRHPKAAVKWHKIRHLWLDTD